MRACRGAVFFCGSMVCEFFEEDGVIEIQDVVWAEVGEGALAALDVFEHQGDVRRDGLGQGVEKVPQVLKWRAHVHGGQNGRLVEVPGARACRTGIGVEDGQRKVVRRLQANHITIIQYLEVGFRRGLWRGIRCGQVQNIGPKRSQTNRLEAIIGVDQSISVRRREVMLDEVWRQVGKVNEAQGRCIPNEKGADVNPANAALIMHALCIEITGLDAQLTVVGEDFGETVHGQQIMDEVLDVHPAVDGAPFERFKQAGPSYLHCMDTRPSFALVFDVFEVLECFMSLLLTPPRPQIFKQLMRWVVLACLGNTSELGHVVGEFDVLAIIKHLAPGITPRAIVVGPTPGDILPDFLLAKEVWRDQDVLVKQITRALGGYAALGGPLHCLLLNEL